MNKKINKIKGKALLLTLCVSLMSFAGCGGSNETSGNNETQVQTTQEVENTEATTLTREELLFGDVWLCGKKIDFPCKVKDLPEGFVLGKGVVISTSRGNAAGIEVLHNNEKVGQITIYGVDKEVGGFYDFSEGYGEYYVRHLTDVGYVSVSNIRSTSSKDDIIKILGQPDLIENEIFYYWLDSNELSSVQFSFSSYESNKVDIMLVNWEE
ncbi:MAG: hypothetical protein IJB96_05525 [Lachnospira sp.]|nr:hypothetical protein [Lachnospira sp.]